MKNKKGFTLIEILVVIALLGVITGSTVFGLEGINEKTKERRLKDLIKEVELAADVYINNNSGYREELLNGSISEICTKINILQDEGLLEEDLKNPVTNEEISKDQCVISKVNEQDLIIHSFEIK